MDRHGPKRSPMVQNSQKSIISCSILQFIRRGALNSIPWSWFQCLSNKRPSAGFGWGVPSLPFFLKVFSQQHLIAEKKNPKSKTTFIEIFEVIYFFPLFLCCCKGVESVKSANFNARGIEITNFRSPQLAERLTDCRTDGRLSDGWRTVWVMTNCLAERGFPEN